MEGDAARRGLAELVGTFALTFVALGSIMAARGDLLAGAIAQGLIVAIMVTALAHVSGAHLNPAVTLGFLVTRRIAPRLAAVYWAAQLLGATIAAGLARWFYSDEVIDSFALGAPRLGSAGAGTGFAVEIVLTLLLVWVIFAVAVDPGNAFRVVGGFAIGLTVAVDILVGGPVSGAAMNPARAFGPFLVHNHWDDDWVWLTGPLVGGVAAAVGYDRIFLHRPRPAASVP